MNNLTLASLPTTLLRLMIILLYISHCHCHTKEAITAYDEINGPRPRSQVQPARFPAVVADFDNRIIGGQDTGLHEFPSIVSIQYQINKNRPNIYNHTCTGSVYNKYWILTAGHCSVIGPNKKYRILAGAHNMYSFTGSEQFRNVSDIQTHPLYSSYTVDYDIAMMMVDTPFEFNEDVKPVRLSPDGYTATGTAIAAGWGLTNKTAKAVPAKLQKITLPIVEREQCKTSYDKENLSAKVTPRMLCAGGQQDRNVCHGDSGGPLYSSDDNGLILSGLTSWGLGCADAGWPGVFTNVSYFQDWIGCISTQTSSLGVLQSLGCWFGQFGSGRTAYLDNFNHGQV